MIDFVIAELLLGVTIALPVRGIQIICHNLEIENQSILDLFFQDYFPCKGSLFLDILFILFVLAMMIFLLIRFLKTKNDHYIATARHWFYFAAIVGFFLCMHSTYNSYVAAEWISP